MFASNASKEFITRHHQPIFSLCHGVNMKKLALCLCLLYLSPHTHLYADTISLVADDWCPINCTPNSETPGYVVEIAIKVFETAGHQVEYQYLSWNRALAQVASGKYVGAIAATPKELPNGIFPDEELGYYGNYFIVKKGNDWKYTSMESLKSIKLAVIQGYNYGKNMSDYIVKNPDKVIQMGGNDVVRRILLMMQQGRVDAYLEDRNIAFYTAKQNNLMDEIEVAGTEGTPIAMYIGFSSALPQSKEYAKILSDGILRLRKNGQLKIILDKYGVTDWK